MSLSTFSLFYYGFEITNDNRFLSFQEVAPTEIVAEIETGDWTATELAVKIKQALDLAGTQIYFVEFDRNLRRYTISAAGNFTLLVGNSTSGGSVFSTIGFTGADRTGANSYTGNEQAGDAYEPQFILQDYVPSSNLKRLVSPAINKAASGRVEVVRFGVERLAKMNIKFATNLPQDGTVIKNNPTGVEDLERFLTFAINKIPFEFMPDIDNKNNFETVLLESFFANESGTGFELIELYDKNLPGYFETGVFTLRRLEI
jgi:hypothetical protein